ncbi:MAG: L-threonylcarbamoyladenylate synthase [Cyanobacteria bacterium K_DeepCast_0m_m1_088]|nr:L-threonylcarbamoyladenylate synthase [Cyanobacteria bacterium K_DeepCast_0m_m1_088]
MTTFLEPADLAEHLQTGGAALLPTDTLVALAALPQYAGQIWQLKQRPPDKPLILMGADLAQLQQHTPGVQWPAQALKLAARHWPGALTLVLPARGDLVTWLNPGGASLGLRVPACPMAQELLGLSGPLATTSANRSGQPAATTAAAAAASFAAQEVPMLGPQSWPAPSGRASTVLGWEGETWRVLRAGSVRV